MNFFYTLCIAPINKQFDYYSIEGLAFNNPVQMGDIVEFRDVELEVCTVLHECNGKSFLYVKTDEKI